MEFKTDITVFEAEIIDRLVSKPPEPDETEFGELTRKAMNSYRYLLELRWLSTMRIWEDTNFMHRPWWMFWVSKERFFEKAFKRHLVEVEQKRENRGSLQVRSKTCSICGCVQDKMPLNIREWTCPECGACHDRDVNAATNLLRQAMSEVTHGERPALVISEISDVTKLDSLNRESYKIICYE